MKLPEPKDQKYLIDYVDFIESRRGLELPEYTEDHHILPRSMGGTNDKSNMILLSAKDHYYAHKLLWLAYRNVQMTIAFWRMSHDKKHNPITGEEYQLLREEQAKHLSVLNSKITTEWHKNKSDEVEAIRALKISQTLKDNYKNFSEEEKEQYRLRYTGINKKPKTKAVCRMHDKKEMPMAHYIRWLMSEPQPMISRLVDRKVMTIPDFNRWLGSKKLNVKVKVVSRITDRKEMSLSHFNQWLIRIGC